METCNHVAMAPDVICKCWVKQLCLIVKGDTIVEQMKSVKLNFVREILPTYQKSFQVQYLIVNSFFPVNLRNTVA